MAYLSRFDHLFVAYHVLNNFILTKHDFLPPLLMAYFSRFGHLSMAYYVLNNFLLTNHDFLPSLLMTYFQGLTTSPWPTIFLMTSY